MTVPADPRIAAAQARATAARARLGGTIDALKQRVTPRALAQDAAETIKDKGRDLAAAATRRPGTAAAIAGGAVLLLARRRIARLFISATGRALGRLPSHRTKDTDDE